MVCLPASPSLPSHLPKFTTNPHLSQILRDCITYTEHRHAKTVTVTDVSNTVPPRTLDMAGITRGISKLTRTKKVIFALRRIGKPIYGFDPETWEPPARGAHRRALTQGSQAGRGGEDNSD